MHHPHEGRYEDSGTGTDTCDRFYGFGAGSAAAAKRNASIEKTAMLRILPDASWHAARDHPLHADQFSLLARCEPTKLSERLHASWTSRCATPSSTGQNRASPRVTGTRLGTSAANLFGSV